jgi:alkanesulfonate monooxygenase SsuD/methylene tetrahydromethanopterin reductase-like flavin-dependent oxidoreductase (luciferase family)
VADRTVDAPQTDRGSIRWGLWYDFRNPDHRHRPHEELYEQSLDQIVLAEELGYGSVWLTEHHFVEDGYTPSPLTIAAAIGARTTSLRIGTSVMLLPLHDPIRLAEDSVSLSILTRGRFDLGVGLGYRQQEFEAFGRNPKNRPSLLEEGAAIIRRFWNGESLEFQGKRYRTPDVNPSPIAARPPRLLVGGKSEASIDRAARIADGFLSTRNQHQQPYVDALLRNGKDPISHSIHAGQWVIVDDDPERTWQRIGDHALYQMNSYAAWGAFGPPVEKAYADRDEILARGVYELWDGPTAVRELTTLLIARPEIQDVYFWSQLPGESVESGTERMEFFIRQVAPKVEQNLGLESVLNGQRKGDSNGKT